MLTIRQAIPEDLVSITEIYNQAILNATATFDTVVKTIEEQRPWFEKHNAKYPLLVALEGDLIIGWASLSPWSDRCAYADTAEISLYIDEKHRGKGIGRKLSEEVLKAGKEVGLHTAIARVAGGNDVSIYLAESLGFRQIGVMKEVGKKFGQLLDVYILQIIFR